MSYSVGFTDFSSKSISSSFSSLGLGNLSFPKTFAATNPQPPSESLQSNSLLYSSVGALSVGSLAALTVSRLRPNPLKSGIKGFASSFLSPEVLALTATTGLSIYHSIQQNNFNNRNSFATIESSSNFSSVTGGAISGALTFGSFGLLQSSFNSDSFLLNKFPSLTKAGRNVRLTLGLAALSGFINYSSQLSNPDDVFRDDLGSFIKGASLGLYAGTVLSVPSKSKSLAIGALVGAVAISPLLEESIENPLLRYSASAAVGALSAHLIRPGRTPASSAIIGAATGAIISAFLSNKTIKPSSDDVKPELHTQPSISSSKTPQPYLVENDSVIYGSETVGRGLREFLHSVPNDSLISSLYTIQVGKSFSLPTSESYDALSLLYKKSETINLNIGQNSLTSLSSPENSSFLEKIFFNTLGLYSGGGIDLPKIKPIFFTGLQVGFIEDDSQAEKQVREKQNQLSNWKTNTVDVTSSQRLVNFKSDSRVHTKVYVTKEDSGVNKAFVSTANYGKNYFLGNKDAFISTLESGVLVTHEESVKELREFVEKMPQISKEFAEEVPSMGFSRTLRQLSSKFKHVIMGGAGSNSEQKIIDLLMRPGDVFMLAPYANSEGIRAALISKLRQGENVTIVTGGSKLSTASHKNTKNFFVELQKQGAKVYVNKENLQRAKQNKEVHYKMFTVYNRQNPKQSVSYIGSHNFSRPSDTESIEVGLYIPGNKTADAIKDLVGDVLSSQKNGKDAYSPLDLDVLEEIIRKKNPQTSDALAQAFKKNYILGHFIPSLYRSTPSDRTTLQLPSTLPSDFYSKYPGSFISLYQDTYTAATGKELTGLPRYLAKWADFSFRQSGFGSFLNTVFPDVYQEGYGLLGSFTKGVGRILDTLTGFYVSEHFERVREGKTKGSIKKFHSSFYDKNNERGFFENSLFSTFASLSSTVYSISFYFGISHTFSILQAHIEDAGIDEIISNIFSPTKQGQIYKSIFVSPSMSNSIDTILTKLPSSDNIPAGKRIDEYYDYIIKRAAQLKNYTVNSSNIETYLQNNITPSIKTSLDLEFSTESHTKNLIHYVASKLEEGNGMNITDPVVTKRLADLEINILGYDRANSELDLSKTYSDSNNPFTNRWFNILSRTRGVDSFNLENIIIPILESIAVVPDQQSQDTFDSLLKNLSSNISKTPFVKLREGDVFVKQFDQLQVEQYGYSRLEVIASLLDKISEYIPANPLYYFKPYRDALGITSLRTSKDLGSDVEDYSLKQLLAPGFSGLTTFSKRITSSILKNIKFSKGQIDEIDEIQQLYTLNKRLTKAEQTLSKQYEKILSTMSDDFTELSKSINLSSHDTSTLLQDLTERLYGQPDNRKLLTNSLDQLFNNNQRLLNLYYEDLEQYNLLLSNKFNYASSLDSQKPNIFKRVRGFLMATGPILLLDRVLDPHFMRNSGDLVNQVLGDLFLTKDEGVQYLKTEYTGGVPSYIKYPLTAAGFTLGGTLLPKFDYSPNSGSNLLEQLFESKVSDTPGILKTVNAIRSSTNNIPFDSIFDILPEDQLKSLFSSSPDTLSLLNKLRSIPGRNHIKFGMFGAFLGGTATLLSTQTTFSLASGIFNIFNSLSSQSITTDFDNFIAAMTLDKAIQRTLQPSSDSEGLYTYNKDLTIRQAAILGVSATSAYNLLYGSSGNEQVFYNFSQQIPNPIFQLTFVSKIDPRGNTISMGAGFQFFPLLGTGSIPPAPFQLRLRPFTSSLYERRRESLLTKLGINESSSLNSNENLSFALSLLSFPKHFISVDKESSASTIINFVGASSFIASGADSLYSYISKNSKGNLRKELLNFKKPYHILKFVANSFETLARYSQTPIVALPNVMVRNAARLLNLSQPLNKYASLLGPTIRKALPFALSYLYASGITSDDSDFSNIGSFLEPNAAAAELYRFTTSTLPITTIYGYGLYKSKVFDHASSFASATDSTFIGRKKRAIYDIYQKSLSLGKPSVSFIKTVPLRISIASRRIFSISAAVASFGLLFRGLTGKGLGFTDIISDSSSPFPTVEESIFNPNNRSTRYAPKNLKESLVSIADYLFNSVTSIFGLKGIIYQDDPNAFISIAGPIGLSEGKSSFRMYTQAQGTFADISGSQYSFYTMFNMADFQKVMRSIITSNSKSNKHLTIEQLYSRMLGAFPRRTPAALRGLLTSYESQALSGSSYALSLAINYRLQEAKRLSYQRPSELSKDFLYDRYKTGKLDPKLFGNNVINFSYSPFDSLDYSGYFSLPIKSNIYESIAKHLYNFFNQSNISYQNVNFNLLNPYKAKEQDQSPLGYFYNMFRFGLQGFSGGSTLGASLFIIPTQIALAGAVFSSSVSFITQTLASAAAYRQHSWSRSVSNSLEEQLNELRRLKSPFLGIAKDDKGLYTLIHDPSIGHLTDGSSKSFYNKQKPRILLNTNKFTRRFKHIFSDDQGNKELLAVARQVRSTFSSYYETLIDVLSPGGNVSGLNTLIENFSSKNISSADFIDSIKKHFETNVFDKYVFSYTTRSKGKPKTQKVSLRQIFDLDNLESSSQLLNTFDKLSAELDTILTSNLSDDIKVNKIKLVLTKGYKDVHSYIFKGVHSQVLSDIEYLNSVGVTPPKGLQQNTTTASTPSEKIINRIMATKGFSGILLEGSIGLAKLASKLADFSPFYTVFSTFTQASAESDPLKKMEAAQAASMSINSIPQTLGALYLIKTLSSKGLGAGLGILGVVSLIGLGGYLADQKLFKGSVTKSLQSFAFQLDKNIFNPIYNFNTKLIYNISKTPVLSHLFSALNLPFKVIDPLINSVRSKISHPAISFLADLFLPFTTKQFNEINYRKYSRKSSIGGVNPFKYTSIDVQFEREMLTLSGRQRALQTSPGLEDFVHPSVLGRFLDSEKLLNLRYFDTILSSRALSDFRPTSLGSNLIRLAIQRRVSEADFYGTGSFQRRNPQVLGGIGSSSLIFSFGSAIGATSFKPNITRKSSVLTGARVLLSDLNDLRKLVANNPVFDYISKTYTDFTTAFSNKVIQPVKTFFSNINSFILNKIVQPFSSLLNPVGQLITSIAKSVGNIAAKAFSFIPPAAKAVTEIVKTHPKISLALAGVATSAAIFAGTKDKGSDKFLSVASTTTVLGLTALAAIFPKTAMQIPRALVNLGRLATKHPKTSLILASVLTLGSAIYKFGPGSTFGTSLSVIGGLGILSAVSFGGYYFRGEIISGLKATKEAVINAGKATIQAMPEKVKTFAMDLLELGAKSLPVFKEASKLASRAFQFAYKNAGSITQLGLLGFLSYNLLFTNKNSTREQTRSSYKELLDFTTVSLLTRYWFSSQKKVAPASLHIRPLMTIKGLAGRTAHAKYLAAKSHFSLINTKAKLGRWGAIALGISTISFLNPHIANFLGDLDYFNDNGAFRTILRTSVIGLSVASFLADIKAKSSFNKDFNQDRSLKYKSSRYSRKRRPFPGDDNPPEGGTGTSSPFPGNDNPPEGGTGTSSPFPGNDNPPKGGTGTSSQRGTGTSSPFPGNDNSPKGGTGTSSQRGTGTSSPPPTTNTNRFGKEEINNPLEHTNTPQTRFPAIRNDAAKLLNEVTKPNYKGVAVNTFDLKYKTGSISFSVFYSKGIKDEYYEISEELSSHEYFSKDNNVTFVLEETPESKLLSTIKIKRSGESETSKGRLDFYEAYHVDSKKSVGKYFLSYPDQHSTFRKQLEAIPVTPQDKLFVLGADTLNSIRQEYDPSRTYHSTEKYYRQTKVTIEDFEYKNDTGKYSKMPLEANVIYEISKEQAQEYYPALENNINESVTLSSSRKTVKEILSEFRFLHKTKFVPKERTINLLDTEEYFEKETPGTTLHGVPHRTQDGGYTFELIYQIDESDSNVYLHREKFTLETNKSRFYDDRGIVNKSLFSNDDVYKDYLADNQLTKDITLPLYTLDIEDTRDITNNIIKGDNVYELKTPQTNRYVVSHDLSTQGTKDVHKYYISSKLDLKISVSQQLKDLPLSATDVIFKEKEDYYRRVKVRLDGADVFAAYKLNSEQQARQYDSEIIKLRKSKGIEINNSLFQNPEDLFITHRKIADKYTEKYKLEVEREVKRLTEEVEEAKRLRAEVEPKAEKLQSTTSYENNTVRESPKIVEKLPYSKPQERQKAKLEVTERLNVKPTNFKKHVPNTLQLVTGREYGIINLEEESKIVRGVPRYFNDTDYVFDIIYQEPDNKSFTQYKEQLKSVTTRKNPRYSDPSVLTPEHFSNEEAYKRYERYNLEHVSRNKRSVTYYLNVEGSKDITDKINEGTNITYSKGKAVIAVPSKNSAVKKISINEFYYISSKEDLSFSIKNQVEAAPPTEYDSIIVLESGSSTSYFRRTPFKYKKDNTYTRNPNVFIVYELDSEETARRYNKEILQLKQQNLYKGIPTIDPFNSKSIKEQQSDIISFFENNDRDAISNLIGEESNLVEKARSWVEEWNDNRSRRKTQKQFPGSGTSSGERKKRTEEEIQALREQHQKRKDFIKERRSGTSQQSEQIIVSNKNEIPTQKLSKLDPRNQDFSVQETPTPKIIQEEIVDSQVEVVTNKEQPELQPNNQKLLLQNPFNTFTTALEKSKQWLKQNIKKRVNSNEEELSTFEQTQQQKTNTNIPKIISNTDTTKVFIDFRIPNSIKEKFGRETLVYDRESDIYFENDFTSNNTQRATVYLLDANLNKKKLLNDGITIYRDDIVENLGKILEFRRSNTTNTSDRYNIIENVNLFHPVIVDKELHNIVNKLKSIPVRRTDKIYRDTKDNYFRKIQKVNIIANDNRKYKVPVKIQVTEEEFIEYQKQKAVIEGKTIVEQSEKQYGAGGMTMSLKDEFNVPSLSTDELLKLHESVTFELSIPRVDTPLQVSELAINPSKTKRSYKGVGSRRRLKRFESSRAAALSLDQPQPSPIFDIAYGSFSAYQLLSLNKSSSKQQRKDAYKDFISTTSISSSISYFLRQSRFTGAGKWGGIIGSIGATLTLSDPLANLLSEQDQSSDSLSRTILRSSVVTAGSGLILYNIPNKRKFIQKVPSLLTSKNSLSSIKNWFRASFSLSQFRPTEIVKSLDSIDMKIGSIFSAIDIGTGIYTLFNNPPAETVSREAIADKISRSNLSFLSSSLTIATSPFGLFGVGASILLQMIAFPFIGDALRNFHLDRMKSYGLRYKSSLLDYEQHVTKSTIIGGVLGGAAAVGIGLLAGASAPALAPIGLFGFGVSAIATSVASGYTYTSNKGGGATAYHGDYEYGLGTLEIYNPDGKRIKSVRDLIAHHWGRKAGGIYETVTLDGVPSKQQVRPNWSDSSGKAIVVDFQLRDKKGSASVKVPSPLSGYVSIIPNWGGYTWYSTREDYENRRNPQLKIIHLKDLTLKEGQQVKQGEVIGVQSTAGLPARNTYKHIHAEATPSVMASILKYFNTVGSKSSSSSLTTFTGKVTLDGLKRGGNDLTSEEISKLTPLGQRLYALRNNPIIRALQDAVSIAEGTAFVGGKSTDNYGYGITIGYTFEITDFSTHPFVNTGRKPLRFTNGMHSSASGRYQQMNFQYIRAKPYDKPTNVPDRVFLFGENYLPSFSPGVQDLIFIQALHRRGILESILKGDFNNPKVAQQLSTEYASITINGKGAYTGQGNTKQGDYYGSFLRNVRQRLQEISSEDSGTAASSSSSFSSSTSSVSIKSYLGLPAKLVTSPQRSKAVGVITDVRLSASRVSAQTGAPKVIALTFDDGPNPQFTPQLLDQLKKLNVRATFYVTGDSAVQNPDLIKRIVNEGHALGLHTKSHPTEAEASRMSPEQIAAETNDTLRILSNITGIDFNRTNITFRAPYLAHGSKAAQYAVNQGFISISADIDPADYRQPSANQITNRIVSNAKSGSIVLMHDSARLDERNQRGFSRQSTIDSIPETVNQLRSRGFEFKTVNQLLQIPFGSSISVPVTPQSSPTSTRTPVLDTSSNLRSSSLYSFTKVNISPRNYSERVQVDAYGKRVSNRPLIVLHETVISADRAIDKFKNPNLQMPVSYHTLIKLDGTIIQTVDFSKRAYGAFNSSFKGESVAIDKRYPSVNNFAYHLSFETPADGNNSSARHSGYTAQQYDSMAKVIAELSLKHNIPESRIVTHREIYLDQGKLDPRSLDRKRLLDRVRYYKKQASVPLLQASVKAPPSNSPVVSPQDLHNIRTSKVGFTARQLERIALEFDSGIVAIDRTKKGQPRARQQQIVLKLESKAPKPTIQKHSDPFYPKYDPPTQHSAEVSVNENSQSVSILLQESTQEGFTLLSIDPLYPKHSREDSLKDPVFFKQIG